MLQGILTDVIGRGLSPSLSCMVLKQGRPVFRAVLPETGGDPIYDLASLTKPLLTFPLLLETGLSLDTPVRDHIPDAPDVPLQALVTHTAGLKPWLPLYLYDAPYEDTICRIGTGGPGPAYSCLDYILLARLIARVHTAPFRKLAETAVAGVPGGAIVPGPRPDVQPTEYGNRYELAQARRFIPEPDPTRFRLDTLIHGEVHDLNAWHDGGISGNAGLFANLAGCAELARRFVTLPHWQLPLMQGDGYRYHLGFTGTGIAIRHDGNIIVIFLSNRVHPEVRDIDFSAVRHQVFTAAFREFA